MNKYVVKNCPCYCLEDEHVRSIAEGIKYDGDKLRLAEMIIDRGKER